MTTCYRHPDRPANIACQRCQRYICPEDMREAAVGFQCPECVGAAAKNVRQPRTVAGAVVSPGTNVQIVPAVLIGLNVLAFFAIPRSSQLYSDWLMAGGPVAYGEWWRMITSAFLHAGIMHLVFNMFALWIFGPMLCSVLGNARFLLAYLTAAVMGSAVVYALTPPGVGTVGASGAIYGLFAIGMLLMLRMGQDVRFWIALLGINLVISFTSNVSWQAHVGGFIAGAILGAAFAYAPRNAKALAQVGAFVACWVIIAALIVWRNVDLTGSVTALW